MDRIRITGGKPLRGKIEVGGAKNAALPLMTAALLTKDKVTFSNLPHLADIATMAHLLVQHGVRVGIDGISSVKGALSGNVLDLCAGNITNLTAPYDVVRKMRASILVLGPLLARFGNAKVSLPGGCAIGTRPVDLHLGGLEKLGAKIDLEEGYVHASVKGRLKGAVIEFPIVSVGATENLLMAATLAEGRTILKNAAQEPEISDLVKCLNSMGAKITGIDTSTLTIEGVKELHGTKHSVVPDRIEAGTYAVAAAVTNGELEIIGGRFDIMAATIEKLVEAGIEVKETKDGIKVRRAGKDIKAFNAETQPYPGLATDMQAQLIALATLANGESRIKETIFENRFMHVPEMARMGADIAIEGNMAIIKGVEKLKGAEVMATDLRASVSLVLTALAAEGTTYINRVYHLDRGYERIEEKLKAIGADIERIK